MPVDLMMLNNLGWGSQNSILLLKAWGKYRFKRLTGRHEARIYEQDYKFFAARVKHRRQHTLSNMAVLPVTASSDYWILTCVILMLYSASPLSCTFIEKIAVRSLWI